MHSVEFPVHVHFGREICGTLAEAERREWWLSNGRGAYAAGTVAGTLTRRYHGLLIAPVRPPLDRWLLLAKVDATLIDGDREWPLHTNRWQGGAVEPQGHVHIERFHLEGRLPVWRYALGDLSVEQRIWMEPGKAITYVAFRLATPNIHWNPDRRPRLRVALLVNGRGHHGVTAVGSLDPATVLADDALEIDYGDGLRLMLRAQGGGFELDRGWIERFDLPLERERGLEDVDNHLRVGWAHLELEPGRWCGLAAGLEEPLSADLDGALHRLHHFDRTLLARATMRVPEMADAPPWIHQLVLAANSFLVRPALPENAEGRGVIAGYPWFGEWGRDTMIALPGLTLATGRHDTARRILQTAARHMDQGLLPNRLAEAGDDAAYNTVDAALWYIDAWRAYFEATGDRPALREAFPVLEDIIGWYVRGSRFHIALDPKDGLIRAGEAGVQVTWMDAMVNGRVVTPRHGKPVEVNALWINALEAMVDLAGAAGRDNTRLHAMAETARQGFRRFIRGDGLGLYDVIDGPDGDDPRIRPNQILAVSLTYSPLPAKVQAAVVAVCAHELLTSYGLRSLAPSHSEYRGEYRGGVPDRDGAYHQGPVWPWLLGHYAVAEHRVTGDVLAAQARLAPIADHLRDAGLGQVSEIFDGAPPHHPRGAPAQAWSVACILDAWARLERLKAG